MLFWKYIKKPRKIWAIWHLLWAKEYLVVARTKTMTWQIAKGSVGFLMDTCDQVRNESEATLAEHIIKKQVEANEKAVQEILNGSES